jgi:predicted secreted protein
MGTGQRWIALVNPHIHVSEQALQGADKPGGTEQQIFQVTAVEAGVSSLTFEYRRSWMPEERAARQFLLMLDISPH